MLNKFYQVVKEAAEEKKSLEVSYYDTKYASLCDGHVICYGLNYKHVQTLAKNITTKVQDNLDNLKPYMREGEEEGRWILLDYGSTFVHVMEQSLRSHYKLEELWTKAKQQS